MRIRVTVGQLAVAFAAFGAMCVAFPTVIGAVPKPLTPNQERLLTMNHEDVAIYSQTVAYNAKVRVDIIGACTEAAYAKRFRNLCADVHRG